ncbi:hypothetical protein GN244_ATG00130 [Phytophthora infestans]|uniref:Uncharacterized protein n=1 Tax=Phytophthora infestans TaxID=4787 RepID=A0A833TQR2_PHYIN|nr:hypothetical protein GN244_ATG00130 [Phytophthora infestans]KAF4142806.1 hypothetical protein GN958_ATG08034 [Phytophthora infestans]
MSSQKKKRKQPMPDEGDSDLDLFDEDSDVEPTEVTLSTQATVSSGVDLAIAPSMLGKTFDSWGVFFSTGSSMSDRACWYTARGTAKRQNCTAASERIAPICKYLFSLDVHFGSMHARLPAEIPIDGQKGQAYGKISKLQGNVSRCGRANRSQR